MLMGRADWVPTIIQDGQIILTMYLFRHHITSWEHSTKVTSNYCNTMKVNWRMEGEVWLSRMDVSTQTEWETEFQHMLETTIAEWSVVCHSVSRFYR